MFLETIGIFLILLPLLIIYGFVMKECGIEGVKVLILSIIITAFFTACIIIGVTLLEL